MYSLNGITVVDGLGAGSALVLTKVKTPRDFVGRTFNVDEQTDLFIKSSNAFAHKLRSAMSQPAPDKVRDLFDAAAGFITNESNKEKIISYIEQGMYAYDACNKVFLPYLQKFVQSEDEEIQTQGRELNALARDFIASLDVSTQWTLEVPELKEPTVIIANDLTPARFLCIGSDLVRAVVLEEGKASSHLATVLRELHIPAIFGVEGACEIKNGVNVLVDGENSQVLVEPPTDTTKNINYINFAQEEIEDDSLIDITIACSVGAIFDNNTNHYILHHGIGLLRSEFLFLGYTLEPTFEQMKDTFSALFSKIPNDAPIAARTFDFAGDKQPFFRVKLDDSGPLCGYGAKVGTKLLKKELQALACSVKNREITIVFPLVSRLSEAQYLHDLLAQCLEELDVNGIEHAKVSTAMMIETPAAVLQAVAFAPISSLFIIGSSSLSEYASAPRPTDLSFTPALAKMIAIACKEAFSAKIKIGLAGHFATRRELLPLFLKLGVSYITVDAYSIQKVRTAVEMLPSSKPDFSYDVYNAIMEAKSAEELSLIVNNLNFNG